MNPQITAVTLGVEDMSRAKRFYGEGLGCPIQQDAGQFVSFALGDGSSALSLYTREGLAADAGVPAAGNGFRGFTLSYVVSAAERVDAVLAEAEQAGGTIVKPAAAQPWGGYSGVFADPDGYLWKVAATA